MALGPPMFFIIRLERYCPRAMKITMGSTQLRRKLRRGSVCWISSPLEGGPGIQQPLRQVRVGNQGGLIDGGLLRCR